jgi:hypothetical protein
MKRTEVKIASPAREKTTGNKPNSGSPQKSERKNTQGTRTPAEFGNQRIMKPEEWQGGTPKPHQHPSSNENPDLDDLEELEDMVDEEE